MGPANQLGEAQGLLRLNQFQEFANRLCDKHYISKNVHFERNGAIIDLSLPLTLITAYPKRS
jgi:hypothetical protein